MAFGPGQSQNRLLTGAAVGLFVLGGLLLLNSVVKRVAVTRVTPEDIRLREQGYGNLLSAPAKLRPAQNVVVSTARIAPGDSIAREFLELRSAASVVQDHPEFKRPAADKDPNEPLVEGFCDRLDAVEGRFAALEIPEGSPIAPSMVMARNPYRNPLDDLRQDRLTVAMPDEPTLYPLLAPGDRVDIMLVSGEQAVRRVMDNVRVVAVNYLVTKQSGILPQRQEARLSIRAEAARRKHAQIVSRVHATQTNAEETPEEAAARQGQPGQQAQPPQQGPPQQPNQPNQPQQGQAAQAGQAGQQAEPDTDPSTPEEPTKAEAEGGNKPVQHATGAVSEKNLPEDVYKVGRKFNGEAVTLQVTREEAMFLSLAEQTPGVRLDFALHRRR